MSSVQIRQSETHSLAHGGVVVLELTTKIVSRIQDDHEADDIEFGLDGSRLSVYGYSRDILKEHAKE